MAVVRPFRAVRYVREPGSDVSSLTAPPYDVISAGYREKLLAGDAHNVVALELPEGALDPAMPGNRYDTGAARWREWGSDGTLAADPAPAVYLLEQRFTMHHRPIRRRALVVAVDLEPFSAGIVLPHERTLPKALTDRIEMLRATSANLSQVLGLFSDPDGETDALMETEGIGDPVMEARDGDGVESRVWALTDPAVAETVAAIFADKRIFIADGHHRYTTALAYRDERRAADGRTDGSRPWQPYDAVMMALVNMDDPELVVLPTHRVADAPGTFDEAAFFAGLERRFDLSACPDDPIDALRDLTAPATFVVRTRSGRMVVARVKDSVHLRDEMAAVPGSDAWKSLDVAVLQELILKPLLGIHPDDPSTLDRLRFWKGAEVALAAADRHDVAFALRPTRMDQLRAVSLGGELMPQKSTYFYPKLLSGLLMRDLA